MRTFRALAASVVAGGTLLCAAPREASAQSAAEANGLGEKGQLILTVDRLMPVFSFTSQTVTTTGPGGQSLEDSQTGTSMAFLLGREPSLGIVHTLPRIAFDFTVIERLTVGGSLAVAFGLGGSQESDQPNGTTVNTKTPRTSIIGFAPRVGYIIPLHKNFAFWPRAGFAIYAVSTKRDVVIGNAPAKVTDSDTVFSIDLDPQFAWTPIPHFFFHAGPLLNIPVGGSRSTETDLGNTSRTDKNDLSVLHFGITAGLGGWFDL
jgi:hypothetical protein